MVCLFLHSSFTRSCLEYRGWARKSWRNLESFEVPCPVSKLHVLSWDFSVMSPLRAFLLLHGTMPISLRLKSKKEHSLLVLPFFLGSTLLSLSSHKIDKFLSPCLMTLSGYSYLPWLLWYHCSWIPFFLATTQIPVSFFSVIFQSSSCCVFSFSLYKLSFGSHTLIYLCPLKLPDLEMLWKLLRASNLCIFNCLLGFYTWIFQKHLYLNQ